MRRYRALIGLALSLLYSPASHAFVDIEQVQWGFTGTVMPGCQVPLSVLVRNNTTEPFPGPVYVSESQGLGGLGVMEAQSCYLAPGQQRWVQFSLKQDYWQNSTLTWRDGKTWNSYNLNAPGNAEKPIVALISSPTSRSRAHVPRFPERLFPNNYAATRMLHGAVLDHMPDWPKAKRIAFVDWVRNGGRLLVIHERDGRFPQFTDELDRFNRKMDEAERGFGRGQVLFLPQTASTLKDQHLPSALNEFHQNPKHKNFGNSRTDQTLLSYLRLSMLPDHPWGTLNALSLLYLLLVGPLAMILFRTRIRKVRWAMLYLFGTVVLFSALFHHLGRRGYGEKTSSSELILARTLSPGRFHTRGWSQVFVTDSGSYTLGFGSGTHFIEIPNQGGGLSGSYLEGTAAAANITLPVYSTAGLLRESITPGPEIRLEWLEEGKAFVLHGLPEQKPIWTAAIIDGELDPLRHQSGNRYTIEDGHKENVLRAWDQRVNFYQLNNRHQNIDAEEKEEIAFIMMAAESLQLPLLQSHQNQSAPLPVLGEQGTHLFIAMPAPETFLLQNPDLQKRQATILYHLDLTVLESPHD